MIYVDDNQYKVRLTSEKLRVPLNYYCITRMFASIKHVQTLQAFITLQTGTGNDIRSLARTQ